MGLLGRLRTKRKADGPDTPAKGGKARSFLRRRKKKQAEESAPDATPEAGAAAPKKARGGGIRFKSATGVVIAKDRLVATTVALTPTGVKELEPVEVVFGDGTLADGLRELAAQGGLSGGALTVGLESKEVFYGSQRCGIDGVAPNDVVPATLAASVRHGGGLIRDTMQLKVQGAVLESVAACRRHVAEDVLAGIDEAKRPKAALDVVALAIHLRARSKAKIPRRWKTYVHVVLGEGRGLAILAHRGHPLAWREFQSVSGGEVYAVIGGVMALQAHAQTDLEFKGLDGVIVHDGENEALAVQCGQQLGIATRTAPAVGLDLASASVALAMAALRRGDRSLDLFRSLRPDPTALQLFPTRIAVLLLIILGVGAYFLWDGAVRLERQTKQTEARALKSMRTAGLTRKTLTEKLKYNNHALEEARVFVGTRIFWAPILQELPELLPRSATVTSILASNRVPLKDLATGRRIKKDLVSISCEVTVQSEQTYPNQPLEIVDALGAAEICNRSFNDVRVGTVTRLKAQGNGEDTAIFTITLRKLAAR